MKLLLNTVTCIFLLCSTLQVIGQNRPSRQYTVKGQIFGIDSGKIYRLSSNLDAIDSATILNGRFVLTGNIDLPEKKVFKITPGNWQVYVFLDVPDITLQIDTTGAQHQYYNGGDDPIITQVKETGSPLANTYSMYERETGITAYKLLDKKLRTAKSDSAVFFKSQMDSIIKVFPETQKKWIEKYIQQNPTSVAGLYIFKNDYYDQLHTTSPEYLRFILKQFSGQAKSSSYYQNLKDWLSALEKTQPGKIAPDFILPKRNLKKLKLSSTRGTVVMLDFWASWCVPCREGIPKWKEVYKRYHHKGFDIISISDDRNWSDWTKALDKETMPWFQVIDKHSSRTAPGIVGELYSTRYIPYFVLINKRGRIILASECEEIVEARLQRIFNK